MRTGLFAPGNEPDVYTFHAARELLPSGLADAIARESRLARLPGIRQRGHDPGRWRNLLPLMPRYFARLDLQAYDLVISSSHACAVNVRPRPDAVHLCYCYTPMRYAWEWREEIGRVPKLIRPAWPLAAGTFRRLDRGWASKVASFIVISEFIRRRVQHAYGRDAAICHPPVDTAFFQPQQVPREDFYLCLGRMVPYKHHDFAILATARARRRLVLVGSGPEMARLKQLPGAARWAEFRGTVPREEVRDLLCRCRALLFPGVEDFGIAMAEAQATATPVVALGSGGAAEIVTHGETGLLYDRPDPGGLAEAMVAFERLERTGGFSPSRIRDNALRFARSTFPSRFTAALGECL
jgi:glycosyltransferase involved in cell wall biosynthesis